MSITKGTGIPGTDTTAPEYARAARDQAIQAKGDPAWRHAWNEGVRAERIRACAIVGERLRDLLGGEAEDLYARHVLRVLIATIDADHTMIVEEP